jgi:2-isopropylmalate synthase
MHEYETTESGEWAVPYLPIDPSDVGRTYESIIRINSQSGKGGIAYVLEKDFGFKLPKAMQPEFGQIIQAVTDREGRELQRDEIFTTFETEYLTISDPYDLDSFNVVKRHINKGGKGSQADVEAILLVHGKEMTASASGNGPLDAFCSALKQKVTGDFTLTSYHEHALNGGSSAKAAAYIEIKAPNGLAYWGTGVDTDIIIASIKAVLSSLNRMEKYSQNID